MVRVQVGVDAAVVANHHVCVRETTIDGQVWLTRFHVPPTIAGLRRLGDRSRGARRGRRRRADIDDLVGVFGGVGEAGADLSLVGTRHAARPPGAISGKHKSDVLDADVLATVNDVFALSPLKPPQVGPWRWGARSCAGGSWSSTATAPAAA